MRRQNEVGQAQLEQRVALPGRLPGEDVEAGARDQALLQRLHQSPLVHQSTPRRIDQNGRALHSAELLDADHVASVRGQRHVQRDHVALGQHLIERGEYHPRRLGRCVIGEQHPHAEAAGDIRRSLAEHAFADDAEGRAVQITDRVVEEAELIDLLPAALFHIFAVCDEVAPQRRDQRERVLGHGVYRVVADVRDRDAVGLAVSDIDHVVAGGGDRNQLQLRQAPQRFGAQRHLVSDGNGGLLQPLHELARARNRVFLPRVLERGAPHPGL